MTKIINRQAIVWPKGQPTKLKDLDLIFRAMGPNATVNFIIGVLGFKPNNSLKWKRLNWITYLKGYIFNPITNGLAENEIIRTFNNTFVIGEPYFNYIDNEWYI